MSDKAGFQRNLPYANTGNDISQNFLLHILVPTTVDYATGKKYLFSVEFGDKQCPFFDNSEKNFVISVLEKVFGSYKSMMGFI